MITRNDFIEKLSKWLTPETCNALADYAESHACGEKMAGDMIYEW